MKVWKFLLTCVSNSAFYFKTITLFTGTTTQWLGKRRQNVKILSNKTKLKVIQKTHFQNHYLFLCLQSFCLIVIVHRKISDDEIWHISHFPNLYSIIFCDNPFNVAGFHTIWSTNATMQMEYFNGWLLWLVRMEVISILSLQLSCQHGLGLILIESAPYNTTH